MMKMPRNGPPGSGPLVFDTGLVTVISDDPTNDVANPITQVFRAIDLKDLMLDVWIGARTKAQVRIGIQFSDNPTDFSSAVQKEFSAGYLTTAGWNYGASWIDIWNLSGLANADYRMYCRIVALVKTTNSSTKLESMIVRVRSQGKPIRPRTLVAPWVLANSAGSTSTGAIHPCTGALPADGVAFHRVMTELSGATGISVQLRWQETNTTDDAASWGGGGTIGSAMTTNGMTYPGKIVAVAPTKRYMRYVVDVTNGAGTDIEGVRVHLTIDQRDR